MLVYEYRQCNAIRTKDELSSSSTLSKKSNTVTMFHLTEFGLINHDIILDLHESNTFFHNFFYIQEKTKKMQEASHCLQKF